MRGAVRVPAGGLVSDPGLARTAIKNTLGYRFLHDGGQNLVNNLRAFWPLRGNTAPHVDLMSVAPLDTDGAGWQTGPVGLGACTTYLTTMTAEADFLPEGIGGSAQHVSFVAAIWFHHTAIEAKYLFAHWQASGNKRCWTLGADSGLGAGTGKLIASFSTNGSDSADLTGTDTYSQSTWNLAALYHDADNDEVALSLNGNPWEQKTAHTGGIYGGSSDLSVGSASASFPFIGSLGDAGLWVMTRPSDA